MYIFFFQIAGKFKFKIGEQSFGNNPIKDLSEIYYINTFRD